MRKMIIAAISAIAVIASVIGCQVYDSQTNSVLASWMDKNDSDIQKYEELVTEFNDACIKFKDASTDDESYNKIVDTYLGFEKFYAAAMVAVEKHANSEKTSEIESTPNDKVAITEKYNEYLHDRDWCKSQYKQHYMTKAVVWSDLIANGTKKAKLYPNMTMWDYFKVKIKANSSEDKATWAISSLYEDEYKLRWDYNSKK